jgi:metal-responsive CopG/Arc/MetJ family transcriptional regulator
MNNAKLLVNIILDKAIDSAEREDALIYLREYKEEFIEDALIKVIQDSEEEHDLRSDACETLAFFWIKKNKYNLQKLAVLPKEYRNDVIGILKHIKLDWIPILEKL